MRNPTLLACGTRRSHPRPCRASLPEAPAVRDGHAKLSRFVVPSADLDHPGYPVAASCDRTPTAKAVVGDEPAGEPLRAARLHREARRPPRREPGDRTVSHPDVASVPDVAPKVRFTPGF